MGLAGLGSPTHIILILVVVLLLFGAKRLPELGKSLGQGINEFKDGLNSKEEPEEKHPNAVEGKQAGATPASEGNPVEKEAARAEGSSKQH